MSGSDGTERRTAGEQREAVLLALGCAMCGVWIIGVLVQVVFPSHPLPNQVHAVILVLVPLLFGSAFLSARKNGKT